MPTKPKSPTRNYSAKTIKVLFALSGNRCAVPDCPNPIIKAGTQFSEEVVLGEICHIYAVSEDGPRGKSGLTEKEKNSPKNLVLCCPTHHTVVDKQHETYPATMLLDWKAKQERAYGERLSAKMNSIGYAELEVAAQALLSTPTTTDETPTVVPPQDKIERNGLSSAVAMLLTMGTSKSREVGDVLVKAAQLDSEFPDRLRSGFVQRYAELQKEGFEADELFFALYDWAGGDGSDARLASGLCILSHLFVICDVFEK